MNLSWAEFTAKYLVIIVSAGWVLLSGTELINKKLKQQELKIKLISKDQIGLVDHSLTLKESGSIWGSGNDLCTITGKYTLKNTGVLPVIFESVTFRVFELPPILETEVLDSENGIISKTISKQLDILSPIYSETIDSSERVGANGSLERLYKYALQIKPNYSYAIEANAYGGLSTSDGKLDESIKFGENEFQHIVLKSLCGTQ